MTYSSVLRYLVLIVDNGPRLICGMVQALGDRAKASKIDEVDLKIIQELLKNARMDYRSISEVVGISDRTIARRIQELENNCIIRGYRVELDDSAILHAGLEKERISEPFIKITMSEWDELWDALYEIFGMGLKAVLFHAGSAVGKVIGGKLLESFSKREEALLAFPALMESRGWRGTHFTKFDPSNKCGQLVFSGYMTDIDKHLHGVWWEWCRGIIAGTLEILLDRKLKIVYRKDGKGAHLFEFG